MSAPNTPRQEREAEYFDQLWSGRAQWESSFPPEEIAFESLSGRRRPYNMGWEYILAVRSLGIAGKDVLEMGRGPGHHTASFAKLGARVWAFDISSAAVETAKRRVQHYGLRADLSVMPAERLSYPDQSFDFVVGYGILHHVSLREGAPEIRRVLRPGGTAVFAERIEWPLFDRIRNLKLITRALPHGGFKAGLDRNVTEDERKLGASDFAELRKHFALVEYREFYFLNRLTEFLPRFESAFQKIDYQLFRWLPFLRRAAAGAIITLR